MQDPFSGKPTCIRGRTLPNAFQRAALQSDLGRRLEAFSRFSEAAARVGIGAHPDDDLFLWEDDELSLFQFESDEWGNLSGAAAQFARLRPIVPLSVFGFPSDSDDPLSVGSAELTYIGGGVEAWAFLAKDGSVYKFYLPREEGTIAGSFSFLPGAEVLIAAEACLGSYRNLLERMVVLDAVGGMPTEFVGVSPEGVIILKQTLGTRLPEYTDVQALFSDRLISIPSRLLRVLRDHPRIVFVNKCPWLLADLHEKNFVVDEEGCARLVDGIVAPFPLNLLRNEPFVLDWLERAERDPKASMLKPVSDDEL